MTNFSSFCSPLPMIAFEPISHSWELSISRTVSPLLAALRASSSLRSGRPHHSLPRVVVVARLASSQQLLLCRAPSSSQEPWQEQPWARPRLLRALASCSFLANSSANFLVLSNSFSRSANSRFFVKHQSLHLLQPSFDFRVQRFDTWEQSFSFFAVLRGAVLDLRVADFDRSAPFDFLTCRCVVFDRGLLFSFAEVFSGGPVLEGPLARLQFQQASLQRRNVETRAHGPDARLVLPES